MDSTVVPGFRVTTTAVLGQLFPPPPGQLWPFPLRLLTPKAGFLASRFRCPSDQPGWRLGSVAFSHIVFPHQAKLAFGEKGLPEHTWGLGAPLFAVGSWGTAGLPLARIDVHLVFPFHLVGLGGFL